MTTCYLTKLLELVQPAPTPPNTPRDPMAYDPEHPFYDVDIAGALPYDPTSPTPPNTPRDPMAYDPEDPASEMDDLDGPEYDPESPPKEPRVISPSECYWATGPAYGLKEHDWKE